MNRKRYSSYKYSGIEWLGAIPDHWNVKKLKHVVDCLDGERVPLNGLERSEMQGEYPYWGANGIVDHVDDWLFDEELVLLGEDGAPFLEKNKDVAFSVKGKIWVNNHIHVLRPSEIDQEYLMYVLNTTSYSPFIEGSTRDKLTQDDMKEIPVLCPPSAEQCTITEYLDNRLAQIGNLIALKERQLELLREKRETIIDHAVTKGFDSSALMKDSGIEWLGSIPENWTPIRSKYVFQEIDERSEFGDEELLTVSHITGVTPRSEKDVYMFMAETLEGYKKCKTGDLVINTMWAWMGALGVTFQDGVVSPSYNVYRLWRLDSVPRYYDRLFRTRRFIDEIIRFSKGVWKSRLRLYPKEFFKIRIPYPPRSEQIAIADYLDEKTSSIDDLMTQIQQSIETLREYRAVIVFSAVTGKIDVRKEVASCQ